MATTEYKLFNSAQKKGYLNIMKINAKSFDLADMSIPVKLYRDTPAVLNSDSLTAATESESQKGGSDTTKFGFSSNVAGATAGNDLSGSKEKQDGNQPQPPKTQKFKRKTKLYYNNSLDYQENRHQSALLKMREYKPWIFEDETRDYSFVGNYQQQDSQYVLFVYENENFSVIPVDHWYKFNTRITYRTLTTDEAESQMKKSGVFMDRWMMHKLNTGPDAVTESQESATMNKMTVVRGEEDLAGDFDEILFGEHFEDDEEYGQDIGEDAQEDDAEVQKRNTVAEKRNSMDFNEKLKKKQETRDTTKLLKKMKQDFLDEDDDEETGDPYAAYFGEVSSDENSDEDEEKKDDKAKEVTSDKITLMDTLSEHKKISPSSLSESPKTSRASSRGGSPPPSISGKRKITIHESSSQSSVISTTERPQKKIKQDKAPEVMIEEALIETFKAATDFSLELPILIEKFKKKLKTQESREAFKTLLKKLSIKQDATRILKPEYRK